LFLLLTASERDTKQKDLQIDDSELFLLLNANDATKKRKRRPLKLTEEEQGIFDTYELLFRAPNVTDEDTNE
jgi:hypothetical protein